jgi:hypothetical protein
LKVVVRSNVVPRRDIHFGAKRMPHDTGFPLLRPLHNDCATQIHRQKSFRDPHVLGRTFRSLKDFFLDFEPLATLCRGLLLRKNNNISVKVPFNWGQTLFTLIIKKYVFNHLGAM